MGADADIPPYRRSGRRAAAMAAIRNAVSARHSMLRDAESQETLGRRAMVRSRRGMTISVATAVVLGLVAAYLFYAFWSEKDLTEAGLVRSAWSLVGATFATGVVYFALGGIERAQRRRQAGERLLQRAQRQRERARVHDKALR
jgi:hypothetical protein